MSETIKRGRPFGTFKPGSLASRVFDLEVGDSVLEMDAKENTRRDCYASIERVTKQEPERAYSLNLYLGVVTTADALPIRFYRIERTE